LSVTSQSDDLLLDQFVAKFEVLDDGLFFFPEIDPIAAELSVGEKGQYGQQLWRPTRCNTEAAQLEPIYARLPGRFPKLFERLILSYRWAEVHLDTFTLLPNPPGPDLGRWLLEASRDAILWDFLLARGYVPFAKGPDIDYDRVCFDLNSRGQEGESRIVKIDHEEVLCNNRLRVVAELAPTFRNLIKQTIAYNPAS
jgi:hypothetical protein